MIQAIDCMKKSIHSPTPHIPQSFKCRHLFDVNARGYLDLWINQVTVYRSRFLVPDRAFVNTVMSTLIEFLE
jgi:hypothetical protein